MANSLSQCLHAKSGDTTICPLVEFTSLVHTSVSYMRNVSSMTALFLNLNIVLDVVVDRRPDVLNIFSVLTVRPGASSAVISVLQG